MSAQHDPASVTVRVFGAAPLGVVRVPRPAAYAVIRDASGRVASVLGAQGWFLPGGGALPGETPEQTVAREVREELGRESRIGVRIGEAIQIFHARKESRWYESRMVFVGASFDGDPLGAAEYELVWRESGSAYYHASHAWAVTIPVA